MYLLFNALLCSSLSESNRLRVCLLLSVFGCIIPSETECCTIDDNVDVFRESFYEFQPLDKDVPPLKVRRCPHSGSLKSFSNVQQTQKSFSTDESKRPVWRSCLFTDQSATVLRHFNKFSHDKWRALGSQFKDLGYPSRGTADVFNELFACCVVETLYSK